MFACMYLCIGLYMFFIHYCYCRVGDTTSKENQYLLSASSTSLLAAILSKASMLAASVIATSLSAASLTAAFCACAPVGKKSR